MSTISFASLGGSAASPTAAALGKSKIGQPGGVSPQQTLVGLVNSAAIPGVTTGKVNILA